MIGLTGGIASGKSAVARRLAFLGAVVLDADRLAREAVEPGAPAWAQVKEAFPQVIQEDQTIDRRLLGEIVFSDAQKRKLLESFIHPEVLRMLLARAAQAKAQGRLVVAEVPLLFEVGWEGLMDEVWVVYVRPEVQLERLLARSSLSREQAERMIESQLPLDVKVSRADRVIDNNGPLEKTWEQVDALWEELQREDRFNRP
ncbi:MAG: dephospho-CoA kinase [Limnochordia bacterium]|jgi:dephospho-CoA kinase|nr:dephospho-CoA kinase [Limnochordia bacterium]MDI9463939.1 dephospho-CoA kinase [Bacillota bacterium]NLO95655.1 dephospho-CoA kinase [Bacillota bacterium]HOB40847.1 dephospho-CoA kinase [Limnochordia bacterium]HOK32124.1 dephospho-CoA kinase [Limnochordia bacterium]